MAIVPATAPPNGGLSLCRDIHHVPLSMKECTSFHTNHGPSNLNSCGNAYSLSSAPGCVSGDRHSRLGARVFSLFR